MAEKTVQTIQFHSRKNSNIVLHTVPGHFVTSSSHVNYYTNVTSLKSNSRNAAVVAKTFVQSISNVATIDTIVCVDGCEVIGAYIAEELQHTNIHTNNPSKSVYVVTPEFNMNGQIIFRDNVSLYLRGKNVILLTATTTTGKTTGRFLDVIGYYGGKVQDIFALFSAVKFIGGIHVEAIFTVDDIPGYQTFEPHECPMCRAGQKIDGMVNAYGLSQI